MRIWFGIADGQISSILTALSSRDTPVFSFPYDNFSKYGWIFTNFLCALILWGSGLGLLIGKFRQLLRELSARDTSVVSFQNDHFSQYQSIFTILGICIDIVICFRIANRPILFMFYRVVSPWHVSLFVSSVFSFPGDNFSKYQWIFMKLAMYIDIVEICFEIANMQILT